MEGFARKLIERGFLFCCPLLLPESILGSSRGLLRRLGVLKLLEPAPGMVVNRAILGIEFA